MRAGDGRKNLAVCSYFRGDYVGFQMLKTWIAVTIAFCILFAVYLVYEMDSLMTDFTALICWGLGKKFGFAYLALCGVYLLAAFVISQKIRPCPRATVKFDKELDLLSGGEDDGFEEEE